MKNVQNNNRLKELRKANNYTQEDVASALGVIRQTYSNYENGKSSLSPTTLFKLAGFYHIDANDLLHLFIDLDVLDSYDLPKASQSARLLEEYLDYLSQPFIQMKMENMSPDEKELLFYYSKLSAKDKKEILSIEKLKIMG